MVKDWALLLLWLGFSPWPRNFPMPWMQSNKKRKLPLKYTIIIATNKIHRGNHNFQLGYFLTGTVMTHNNNVLIKKSLLAQWVKDPALSLCDSGYCCGSGLFPGLRTSTCPGPGQRKKRKGLIKQRRIVSNLKHLTIRLKKHTRKSY